MKRISLTILSVLCFLPAFAQEVADTLHMDSLRRSPVSQVTDVLAGRVAGLAAGFADDAPGRVGEATVGGGAAGAGVLFVVDGFRMDAGYVRSINPARIESIVVLKDPAYTSAYGTSGADGVVMITLKKGQVGKVRVDFDACLGGGIFSKASLAGTEYRRDALKMSAFRQNYSVAVSGGSEVAGNRFFADLSYLGDNGCLKGNAFHRFQGNLSYEQRLGRKLIFNIGASYRNTRDCGIDTSVPYADYKIETVDVEGTPTAVPTPYEAPDSYIMNYVLGQGTDPTATLENAYAKNIQSVITGNLGLKWKILEGFDLDVRGFYCARVSDIQKFNSTRTLFGAKDSPFGMGINSLAFDNMRNDYNGELTLSYRTTLSSGSFISAAAGFHVGGFTDNFRGERTYNMTTEALGTAALNTGVYIPVDLYSDGVLRLSGNADLLYSILGRYDVFAGICVEGSRDMTGWGVHYLPHAGIAWNMAREGFAKDVLSSGKLCASWGMAGTNLVEMAPEGFTAVYNMEHQIRASISAGFLDERVTARFGYFNRMSPLLKNSGFELSATGCPFRTENLRWNIFANATFAKVNGAAAYFGGAGTDLEYRGFDFNANMFWAPGCARIANITAGYTLGRELLKVCSMRFFVNCGNLFHKAMYRGFDPASEPATMAPGRVFVNGGFSVNF